MLGESFLAALKDFKEGRIDQEISETGYQGTDLAIVKVFNSLVAQQLKVSETINHFLHETANENTTARLEVDADVKGFWRRDLESLNASFDAVVAPISTIKDKINALTCGDLEDRVLSTTTAYKELDQAVKELQRELLETNQEIHRVAKELVTKGNLAALAAPRGNGVWQDIIDNVNQIGDGLGSVIREVTLVATKVGEGDFSDTLRSPANGDILQMKNAVNKIPEVLNTVHSGIILTCIELREGRLGAQITKPESLTGSWSEAIDRVNEMASSLASSIRSIQEVATAAMKGDLSKVSQTECKGELLELRNEVNNFVYVMNSLASEVTKVARELGTEGTFNSQAQVQGVENTWKDLVDNINMMSTSIGKQLNSMSELLEEVLQKQDFSKRLNIESQQDMKKLHQSVNSLLAKVESTHQASAQ